MNSFFSYLVSLNYTIDFTSLIICSLVATFLCIPLVINYHLKEIGFIQRSRKSIVHEEASECFSVVIFGICIMCGHNFKIGLIFVIGGLLHIVLTNYKLNKVKKKL